MKLATLRGDQPDGQLVVISRDLTRAVDATAIATSLLEALQRWSEVAPELAHLAARLERDEVASFAFDGRGASAPLPRAPQWLDGSVFQVHLDLMARALHPERPNQPSEFPYVYQGASDDFRGPHDDISGFGLHEGIDFEGEFAVVVDDVPMGTTAQDARSHVRLILMLNDISLRAYAGREIGVGFGFINAKPSTAFAPVAATPDELGDAWRDARVHLDLNVTRSGAWFGNPNGSAMSFGFDELIAHVARTRRLSAGTIIGSGTVSNDDRSVGSACIAERRAIEIIETGAPATAFLGDGETVRMEAFLPDGSSPFGVLEQRVIVG